MRIFHRRSAITRVKLAGALQWRDKKPLGALEIFKLPSPHPTWWWHISKGAKAASRYSDVVLDVTFAGVDDPTVPDFPPWLQEWDDALPSLRQDEALALLDKFLLAERGDLLPGVSLFPLQWLALCAYYCPKREPLTAMKELVAAGRVDGSKAGTIYEDMRWPLTITDRTLDEIRRTRIEARLPTFTKVERWIDAHVKAFPRLLGLGRWAARKGGVNV